MIAGVDAAAVATRLGLDPAGLSPTVQARIEAAIEDTEAKVEAYLQRPLVSDTSTVKDLYPTWGFDLEDYRAWQYVADRFDDVFTVDSYAPAASGQVGYYDVTFTVGLDVAADPSLGAIRAFIAQDAAAALREDPTFTAVTRAVTSVSADGQSVTYEKATTPEAIGARLALTSIKRWRRVSIYARPAGVFTPWPYYTGYGN